MKVIAEPISEPKEVTVQVEYHDDGGATVRLLSFGPVVVMTLTAAERVRLRSQL